MERWHSEKTRSGVNARWKESNIIAMGAGTAGWMVLLQNERETERAVDHLEQDQDQSGAIESGS